MARARLSRPGRPVLLRPVVSSVECPSPVVVSPVGPCAVLSPRVQQPRALSSGEQRPSSPSVDVAAASPRRRTSPLRVAAALLRARRCPARPGRSSTIAVPRYGHLAHCVLVSLARAVSSVITGIARAVVIVCRILALFRACRARSLRAIINYFGIIVRTR
jgi:hypothetical protein